MLHPNDRTYERIEPEDPVTSSEFLKQILDRFHIDLNNPVRHLCSTWNSLAGPSIGSFSQCTGCENGVLEIVCEHPAQLQLVKMSKKEIIKNVNSAFPELKIKDLQVFVKK